MSGRGRVLRGAPQMSDADLKLKAAIEQAGMAPPAPAPSAQVLRLENVGLDVQVDPIEHRLVIVALGGAKIANLFDAVIVPMPAAFAQRLVGQWTAKGEEMAQSVSELGPKLAAVTSAGAEAQEPGPEGAAS